MKCISHMHTVCTHFCAIENWEKIQANSVNFSFIYVPRTYSASWTLTCFAGEVESLDRPDVAGPETSVQKKPISESSQKLGLALWNFWRVDPVTPLWLQVQFPVHFYLVDCCFLLHTLRCVDMTRYIITLSLSTIIADRDQVKCIFRERQRIIIVIVL